MPRFRTALLTAVAIGAALPAIASAQMPDRRSDGEQRGERADRGQRPDQGQPRQSDDRGQRPQAQNQPPQAQPAPQPQQQQQQSAQVQASQSRPDRRDVDRGARGDRPHDFGQQGQRVDAPRGFAGRDDRRPGTDPRQSYDRAQGFDQRRQDTPPPGFAGNAYRNGDRRFAYDRGRDDRRPDARAGGPQGRIGADWRGDRRYDWRGYRDQHRETFRIGRYNPPRAYGNYGYRSFDIGFRLDPYFYASNYWIDDPYDYRLPPVWGSYRWVRYYNDVLLVDLETGEVVDVIHSFFW